MKHTQQPTPGHLFLMGYRGSGKSTVGALLAERWQRPFIDTDRRIESIAQRSIAQIFERDGEEGFRDYEQRAIEALHGEPASVVALGGGAILRPINREQIAANGWTVWLRAGVAQLATRIAQDSASLQTRPGLTRLSPTEEVRHVLELRTPIYEACSDLIVETDHLVPEQVVDQITSWLQSQNRW